MQLESPSHAGDVPVDEEPVMPYGQKKEAHEPMVTQTLYNTLSERFEQLNSDCCNLREDFYRLKEENIPLKEELQKYRYSFIHSQKQRCTSSVSNWTHINHLQLDNGKMKPYCVTACRKSQD